MLYAVLSIEKFIELDGAKKKSWILFYIPDTNPDWLSSFYIRTIELSERESFFYKNILLKEYPRCLKSYIKKLHLVNILFLDHGAGTF